MDITTQQPTVLSHEIWEINGSVACHHKKPYQSPEDQILAEPKEGSIAHSVVLPPSLCPDMTSTVEKDVTTSHLSSRTNEPVK